MTNSNRVAPWSFTNSGSFQVPARAAIFESVELVKAARKRSAASFVNAVLRKIAGAPAEALSLPSKDWPTKDRPTRSGWLGPLLILYGWWNAGRSDMDLRPRGKSALFDQAVPETAIRIHGEQSAVGNTDGELAAAGVQLAPGRLLAARRVLAGT